MDFIINLQSIIDSFLMFFFRYPESPSAGYLFGTCILSILSVLVGNVSAHVSYHYNKHRIDHSNQKIRRYQELSYSALQAGNKESYKACNSIANEQYGRSFFMHVTLAAASLWPAFMALGWMQYRFENIAFSIPLITSGTGYTFGYVSTFIVCYVMIRILFALKKKLIRNSIMKHISYSHPMFR